MADTYEQDYHLALKKTTQWQTYLLVAMGIFYVSVLLLFIGEVMTVYYVSTPFYIFVGIVGTLLACSAYIWTNLWRSIRASRAYLKSAQEEDLIKAYQQQRLFWRNIALLVGIVGGGFAFLFLAVVVFRF